MLDLNTKEKVQENKERNNINHIDKYSEKMELIEIPDNYNMPIIHVVVNETVVGYIRFYKDKHKNMIYLYHIMIKSVYRKKGYATQAMSQLMKKYYGYDIHLHIADYSDIAKRFWIHYFSEKHVYKLENENSYLIKNSNIDRHLPKYNQENENHIKEFVCNDCY